MKSENFSSKSVHILNIFRFYFHLIYDCIIYLMMVWSWDVKESVVKNTQEHDCVNMFLLFSFL